MKFIFVSHDQSFESADPTYGPFNCPSFSILSLDLTILHFVIGSIFLVWDQQSDPSFFQSRTERMAVIRLVGDKFLRSRPGTSSTWPGDANLIQGCFSEPNLSRRGRVDQASQRYTLCIDHHHPLRSLTPLGFSDSRAPFFAGAKLPSMNASSQSNNSCWSSSDRKALHISLNTSCSCHSCNLLQQVDGDGYRSGKSFHLAPERAIHKIPSKTMRSSARGLPPLAPTVGLGINGSILAHCSSVICSWRLFIGSPPMNHIYKKQQKYKGLYQSRLQRLNGFETNSSLQLKKWNML
jgi:hypothetical protein